MIEFISLGISLIALFVSLFIYKETKTVLAEIERIYWWMKYLKR